MLPLAAIRGRVRSVFLQSFLYYVPYAVLGAMTFPAVFSATGSWFSALAGTLAALVLAGSVPGALLLKHVDARAIKVVFGAVIVLLGAEMLLRERQKGKLRSSKLLLVLIGVLAGVLCGLFGVGALLAAYVSRVTDDQNGFKANISAVFVAENTFRIVLYSCLRLITPETLRTALLLLPFALLGLWIGMRSSARLNEKTAGRLVAVLLVLSGVSLIVKNLGM